MSIYFAIDLKSFYASVECRERKLDPLTTNLVVADASRTDKTICLAVSPSLKAHGIAGRARLFEVIQQVKRVNHERLRKAPGHKFSSPSFDALALSSDPTLELSYIVAPPQMRRYMEVSASIYKVYLRYIAPEDIYVYSIDEVFIDATHYLNTYRMSAHQLCMTLIREVLYETGITATGGIGTNMYLAKVAMDIVAKHVPADKDGVRIAELDELSYRQKLWTHEPLTDFWSVGHGTAKKLMEHGLYTMGDVARCSLGEKDNYYNEDLLYKLFGVKAEILIDRAWGYEPTTISLIRQYKPENTSISSGQVLHSPYEYNKARLIVQEMTDLLVLDLVAKRVMTDQLVLTIGYDIENLTKPEIASKYTGPVVTDHYGRKVPKPAHGTVNLEKHSSSTSLIMEAVQALYTRIVNPALLVRRVTLAACRLKYEDEIEEEAQSFHQMDLFSDFGEQAAEKKAAEKKREKERKLQETVLLIKKKYGKNAMLKGMNLQEGATTVMRNSQVGGHSAGAVQRVRVKAVSDKAEKKEGSDPLDEFI